MMIQFCAAVLGCAVWFYFGIADTLRLGDDGALPPNAVPPGAMPILVFLIFRALPACLGLVVLLVTEWLFFRLFFTRED